MDQIRKASAEECQTLTELFASSAIVEKDGSIIGNADSVRFLSQLGVETCLSPQLGPGMYWINNLDFVEAFGDTFRTVGGMAARTTAGQ